MAEADPLLVLVTGASGYIATHLIKNLLKEGVYRVRGTVRNLQATEKVKISHRREIVYNIGWIRPTHQQVHSNFK